MGIVFGRISEEMPAYTVLKKSGIYELRRYAPGVAVETTCRYDNDGFGRLASYIGVLSTPQNTPASISEKGPIPIAMTAPVVMKPVPIAMTAPVVMKSEPVPIAMTAPVVMKDSSATGRQVMQFILPSQFTLETAPIPTDPSVRVVAIPARTFAVHEFSGSWGTEGFLQKRDALYEVLQKEDIAADLEGWESYRYNPPFTLPFLRRNEVAIPITGEIPAVTLSEGETKEPAIGSE